MGYFVRPLAHSKPLAFWKAFLIFFLLFGNNEDGFWGDSNWNPEGKRDLKTAWKWWKRNPFHNLFFHAIGFTDKRTEMWGPHVPSIAHPSGEGWNYHMVRPLGFSWQRFVLSLLYMGSGVSMLYLNMATLPLVIFAWLFFLLGVAMFFAALSIFMFPFLSYTSDLTLIRDVYVGWRPNGAFGFKFQINKTVAQAKYPKIYKLFGKNET